MPLSLSGIPELRRRLLATKLKMKSLLGWFRSTFANAVEKHAPLTFEAEPRCSASLGAKPRSLSEQKVSRENNWANILW